MSKQRKVDDELLKDYVNGRLDSVLEAKVAALLEKHPKLLARLEALSQDGLIHQVRAVNVEEPARTTLPLSVPSKTPGPTSPVLDQMPPELSLSAEYQVLKELGRGGMGVVYLARHLSTDRNEVLKVLNPSLYEHQGAKQRFLNEIKAVARLNHPNIVTCYGIVPAGELVVFAMEYVPGIDLNEFIRRNKPIPVALACNFAKQIATALSAAHAQGLVHRDIKPANIMVYRQDGELQLKILDFGLAKVTNSTGGADLTLDGTMLGTPQYMSPEQILNSAKADIRSDIYSLGCTLYHLLNTRPPFSGTAGEIMVAHTSHNAPLLSTLRSDVSQELALVVARMMAKSPEGRYPFPSEVLKALEPFANSLNNASYGSDIFADATPNHGVSMRDTSIADATATFHSNIKPGSPHFSIAQGSPSTQPNHLSPTKTAAPSSAVGTWRSNQKLLTAGGVAFGFVLLFLMAAVLTGWPASKQNNKTVAQDGQSSKEEPNTNAIPWVPIFANGQFGPDITTDQRLGIENGALRFQEEFIWNPGVQLANFRVRLEFRKQLDDGATLIFRSKGNESDRYILGLIPMDKHSADIGSVHRIYGGDFVGKYLCIDEGKPFLYDPDHWHVLDLTVSGSSIHATLDNQVISDCIDSSFREGEIGLTGSTSNNFEIRNFSYQRLPDTQIETPISAEKPSTLVSSDTWEANQEASTFLTLFNGVDMTHWKYEGSIPQLWSVQDGALQAKRGYPNWDQFINELPEQMRTVRDDFDNFELKVRMKLEESGYTGIVLRRKNEECLEINLATNSNVAGKVTQWAPVRWKLRRELFPPANKLVTIPPNQWFDVRILLAKQRLRLLINEKLIWDEKITGCEDAGPIAFWQPPSSTAKTWIEKVEIRPLSEQEVISFTNNNLMGRRGEQIEELDVQWGPPQNWAQMGSELVCSPGSADLSRIVFGDPAWQDYQLDFDVMFPAVPSSFVTLFDYQQLEDHDFFRISPFSGRVYLGQMSGQNAQNAREPLRPSRWYHFCIITSGTSRRCFIDGDEVARLEGKSHSQGRVGFSIGNLDAGYQFRFRNVRVTLLNENEPTVIPFFDNELAIGPDVAEELSFAWSPPENPDPDAILQEAKRDIDLAQYETALAKLVWFRQHVAEIKKASTAVRNSISMTAWERLIQNYPPAEAPLLQLSNTARERALSSESDSLDAFKDLAVINRALKADDETCRVFNQLHHANPDAAKSVFPYAQRALIKTKSHELYGKYIDPIKDQQRYIAQFLVGLASARNDPNEALYNKTTYKMFAYHSTCLIGVLALNQRLEEANSVAQMAREAWNDPAFHAEVDSALSGKLPEAWPN